MFHSANAIIIYLSLTRILSPCFKSRTTAITGILDNERLWTNQGEKFIQKCKNFRLEWSKFNFENCYFSNNYLIFFLFLWKSINKSGGKCLNCFIHCYSGMHARGFFLSVDSSSDINNWQNWLKIQMMYIIHIDCYSYKNQGQSFIKESAWLLDEQTDWNNFQDDSFLH